MFQIFAQLKPWCFNHPAVALRWKLKNLELVLLLQYSIHFVQFTNTADSKTEHNIPQHNATANMFNSRNSVLRLQNLILTYLKVPKLIFVTVTNYLSRSCLGIPPVDLKLSNKVSFLMFEKILCVSMEEQELYSLRFDCWSWVMYSMSSPSLSVLFPVQLLMNKTHKNSKKYITSYLL